MKIAIITVGKKHDKNIAGAITEYEKRLKKYCDFSWEFVGSTSVDVEASAIIRLVRSDDFVILLDETGQQFDNEELAGCIESVQNQSTKRLVFIIGGAYGVNYSVITRANLTLGISKLVLPHQLVRLIMIEQIYRSYSILSGSNYHHK